MLPVLVPERAPPDPTDDITSLILGSREAMSASCRWYLTICSNEVRSAASVLTLIWPVSSDGMKSVLLFMNITTVAIRLSANRPMMTGLCSMPHLSERS